MTRTASAPIEDYVFHHDTVTGNALHRILRRVFGLCQTVKVHIHNTYVMAPTLCIMYHRAGLL